jgi:hypothetical protein
MTKPHAANASLRTDEIAYMTKIVYFVDRQSRYNRAKKNQFDAKLILTIFRQPLHVSGVSRRIQWTTDSHLKRIISTKCCIHTVVPPDDGSRYARNM